MGRHFGGLVQGTAVNGDGGGSEQQSSIHLDQDDHGNVRSSSNAIASAHVHWSQVEY